MRLLQSVQVDLRSMIALPPVEPLWGKVGLVSVGFLASFWLRNDPETLVILWFLFVYAK